MKYTCEVFPSSSGGPAMLVIVPPAMWPAQRALLDKSAEKHSSYLTLDVSLPHVPRSTGPGSQSAHLHGHLQQLAAHYGTLSMEEMKQLMKWDCVLWPRKRIRVHGREMEIPASEADADTIVESAAIEWCHQRAAEEGLILREGDNE